jgi:CubicO group peptidase (beta-lactamase class C family)
MNFHRQCRSIIPTEVLYLLLIFLLTNSSIAEPSVLERTYPGRVWQTKKPSEAGLNSEKIDAITRLLDGRGCIIRHGFVVKVWGDQSQKGDWLSSSKPVFSTLLFFAVQEGKLDSLHTPIKSFGWDLSTKDEEITFHHLANMISGYARPEKPGAAWAYNDYAINLYRLTLFDRLFKANAGKVASNQNMFGPLQFEDGLSFSKKARVIASVRDFARLGWFWLNKGKWDQKQLLSVDFFDEYCRPHVPKMLSHTEKAKTDDYLEIGSYGGGSDHFTKYGPGIYGYNFWFNATGRDHPARITWPDAPGDAFMTIGAGGNSTAIIPSLDMVIVAARAKWGSPKAGDSSSVMNRVMKMANEAVLDGQMVSKRNYVITGERKKWHPITIDFRGPDTSEKAVNPNPFLEYRLGVQFTSPSGNTYDVPGFYAGDGQGQGSGNIWRVRFTPGEAGEWTFMALFRKGHRVSVSLNANAGESTAFDGCSGTFSVEGCDENALGFLKWGRLEYIGEHYLKFHDGPYWLKGGNDTPEDLLAYKGFDNTPGAKHEYREHVRDWNPGDPDWNNGAGKGIIGFLNYMAEEHVNSIYFMPNNIGGDGKNAWPYVGMIDPKGNPKNDNLHFDISKLHQWEIVFDHAQRKGIFLHFVLNEAEELNKRELDNGKLGIERKLFYRELIARFGHHLALQWNLCEEYNLRFKISPVLAKEYAGYIQAVDPYNHPITIHHAGKAIKAWEPFLGDKRFTVTSFQTQDIDVVEKWRTLSKEAGVPHVIGMDEFFPDKATPENSDRHRMQYIWPIFLSGGQIEFILDELLKTEDFRKYEKHWRYMWYARKFIEENLPFWEMEPADELVVNEGVVQIDVGDSAILEAHAEVFAKPGFVYAVYLPTGNPSGTINLDRINGVYSLRWYNPRTGEFEGDEAFIQGGKQSKIGLPPRQRTRDWVVLIKKNN